MCARIATLCIASLSIALASGCSKKSLDPPAFCAKMKELYGSTSSKRPCVPWISGIKKNNPKVYDCYAGCAAKSADKAVYGECSQACGVVSAPKPSAGEVASSRLARKRKARLRIERDLQLCLKHCRDQKIPDLKQRVYCRTKCAKDAQLARNAL